MEYYPGATSVGIKAVDGVILAADKRVTYGFMLMSKAGKKVFKITDRVGIASAGFISDMQSIARTLEAEIKLYELETGSPIRISGVAKLLSVILYNRRTSPYMIETIVGGIDDKGSHLYICDPIGAVIEDDYTALGSGSQIAIGIIEEAYNEKITVDDARKLAIKSVKSAFSRDAMSGDGIDILVIKKEGTKEEFIRVS
ncbi:MAG: proteasome endopeptidase complex, archaeal, beta subunit [Thermofilum sp. ex4484_79]|nr:MAG: proteasome endopeptidase complex, archaeal, beta subunit [Thermofilum sp. ex4484_79]